MASPPWTERPFLCLDTETTGVDCYEDRIVEVAAVTVNPDGTTDDPWVTIIDPSIDIPDEPAAIHGITTERAKAEGIPTADALTTLADRIYGAGVGTPLVMFNARFDWPLLLAEAERGGVDFPCFAPILDPYLIDRMCDRYRKGGRKLTIVAEHYGVELGDAAHGALADATAAGQVMRAIVTAFPKIGDHVLAGVMIRQVKGHEEDRLRFVDYMRREKDPSFDSAPGWPIPAGKS